MRFRSALVGLLAGPAALVSLARADDPRHTFGLPTRAAAEPAGCSDGRRFECAIATDPLDPATPYALATWLPASYLLRLPVADLNHDSVAGYALGASLHASSAGPGFGGATGLENRWTIEGAPADSLRTGGVETRVPLVFLDGVMVIAGGFSARDRTSTGGAIDARLRRGTADHELAAHAWTTMVTAPRGRSIASGSYSVRRLAVAAGPEVSAAVVATGPVRALGDRIDGTAWYAVGVAPSLATTEFSWRATRLVDADEDGIPDGLPGEVQLATIAFTEERTLDYFVPVMARLGADRGAHQLDVTLVGHAQRDSRFLGNSTVQAGGVDRMTWTGDAIATWRARLGGTRLRAQLAWHHSRRDESARAPAAGRIPQQLSAYIPAMLPDDPALAAACDDTSPLDPARTVPNCPVPFGFFASGGAGLLTDAVSNRPSATVDLAHQLGDHVIRAGGTFEDSKLVPTAAFTGGKQDRTLFPGENQERRFYVGDCAAAAGAPCDYADSSQLLYRTAHAAAYVEDTYRPIPDLAINAGVRWELMWVGPRVHFSRQFAPRFGVAWDPLGGGRSRLWASAGRAFAMLPAGLGPTVIARDATVDDLTFEGGVFRSRDAGSAFRVVPGARPISQDEITLGGELTLGGALHATLWGQARRLRDGLETTRDGFDNPGRRPGEIPASRDTTLIALSVELRQPKSVVRSGVMWGDTVGTWTGPFDPRLGANLLQTPAWDRAASNLYGTLPTAAGGQVFVEAERSAALAGAEVWAATRITIASGTPRNLLGDGASGPVELLPRGSAGTNPVVAQTNLRLGARWRGLTATLDVFNLFARREITSLDETYSGDAAGAIDGGSPEDLVFLKNAGGRPATRLTSFQLATQFQTPLAIALGIHKAF